jgi:hypothetical protein
MSDYPIIRKRRNVFFPHGGSRRAEMHVNDIDDPLNKRRFRADPLKDGFDSQENPIRREGPSPKKPDIPI